MGSPKEVIAPLEDLLELCNKDTFELVAVISQPARPHGRKKILKDPPLATFAKEKNIPTYQPTKCRDTAFLEILRELKPDLIITAAYGQILSQEFLDIPSMATINIHPSLLPEYRGAIPVPAVLLDGKNKTGVSILYTVKALDAGEIISQREFQIKDHETSDVLLARLFKESGPQLVEVVKMFKTGDVESYPQDESKVSHCCKIDKTDGLIDWNQSVLQINNKFRAYYPWPGSYSFTGGKRVVLESMSPYLEDVSESLEIGEFKYIKAIKKLLVRAQDGYFTLESLKPAGSKVQNGAAFWNGQKLDDRGAFKNEA